MGRNKTKPEDLTVVKNMRIKYFDLLYIYELEKEQGVKIEYKDIFSRGLECLKHGISVHNLIPLAECKERENELDSMNNALKLKIVGLQAIIDSLSSLLIEKQVPVGIIRNKLLIDKCSEIMCNDILERCKKIDQDTNFMN